MLSFKEIWYKKVEPTKKDRFILVADVGGTNCNFGIFHLDHSQQELILSLHIKSQLITDFPALVHDVLILTKNTYNITIEHACIAAAGAVAVDRSSVKPTNLSFTINSEELKKATNLRTICLANDFEVIGYGIPLLDPKSIVHVKKGTPQPTAHRAIIGAGTGLGKNILMWHKELDDYIPLASEGGHADFPAHDALELELISFIREREKLSCVSWEDVLSGNGIKRIHSFFKYKNQTTKSDSSVDLNGLDPDKIFKSRTLDDHCARTYELYAKIYARCAKNFALDALALGGLYIAGGIAAKNLPLFEQPGFAQEFILCDKQQELLKRIPIYVIIDYNVSLYGAAAFLKKEGVC